MRRTSIRRWIAACALVACLAWVAPPASALPWFSIDAGISSVFGFLAHAFGIEKARPGSGGGEIETYDSPYIDPNGRSRH